ncbi:MAG TPA: SGNH/GDSL hydrolase family protein [Candidatus Limnocylindrales bacterium]|nr:SGNH/GDSL hydrolase family protein [Candidatus Limnocylindrales bacterium]
MKNSILPLFAAALLAPAAVQAQLTDDFNAPPANCCLAMTAHSLAEQLQDWNQLGRYHAANQELKQRPADPRRVVFMGDSITDLWNLEEYFPGQPYVNRGIGGQTTPQMLVRMYPDVIELKPAAMVLLAGTNDVARNTGPSTPEMIEENIMAMTELAQRHGIKVLLCSITPVSDYPYLAQQSGRAPAPTPAPGRGGRGPMVRQRMTVGRPPADILKLNAWMKDYAKSVNAVYVDYFSALVDDKGWMKDGIANDGLHPNPEGYKIMAPLVSEAIRNALR